MDRKERDISSEIGPTEKLDPKMVIFTAGRRTHAEAFGEDLESGASSTRKRRIKMDRKIIVSTVTVQEYQEGVDFLKMNKTGYS